MKLSYLGKQRLKKILKIAAIVLAALLVLAFIRFIYLERFVVYDETGAHLDFGGSYVSSEEKQNVPDKEKFVLKSEAATSEVIAAPTDGHLYPLRGISISADTLLSCENPDLIVSEAAQHSAVMLELKTDTGKYLYPTDLPNTERVKDAENIGNLITKLSGLTGVTLVAEIPAFPDSAFALSDFSSALPIRGGALWMNENGSYCLDPASQNTRDYLIAQAKELQTLGFDEIVFNGFSFPTSENIVYSGNGAEETRLAAAYIADALKTTGPACSFISKDDAVINLSQRAFIHAQSGDGIPEILERFKVLLGDDNSRLVFLTESRDTRFDPYSVLHPWAPDAQ